jgi:hypothetical protein
MAGSFKTDVLPLFRPIDIKHMKPMRVKLDNHTWMSNPDNAQNVYDKLASKEMPPDGPFWSDAQLKVLSDWMNVDPKYQP